MLCRDCKFWESEWYDEEYEEWRGYGRHRLDRNGVYVDIQVGICALLPRGSRVRLEDVKACKKFERKETVGEDSENILFGE